MRRQTDRVQIWWGRGSLRGRQLIESRSAADRIGIIRTARSVRDERGGIVEVWDAHPFGMRLLRLGRRPLGPWAPRTPPFPARWLPLFDAFGERKRRSGRTQEPERSIDELLRVLDRTAWSRRKVRDALRRLDRRDFAELLDDGEHWHLTSEGRRALHQVRNQVEVWGG